jgi:hypothetical protein
VESRVAEAPGLCAGSRCHDPQPHIEFFRHNTTGKAISFGRGYGQGSNSNGIAGGNAVSDADAEGGGAAEAGTAPMGMTPSTSLGGNTKFIGIGSAAAQNTASGYFGTVGLNQKFTPYVPSFVIPQFPTNPGGLSRLRLPRKLHKLEWNTKQSSFTIWYK